jgi:hypothetical protein
MGRILPPNGSSTDSISRGDAGVAENANAKTLLAADER